MRRAAPGPRRPAGRPRPAARGRLVTLPRPAGRHHGRPRSRRVPGQTARGATRRAAPPARPGTL